MRIDQALLLVLALVPAAAFGQEYGVRWPPGDLRLGKYLVEVCTVKPGDTGCTGTRPQKIDLRQVCGAKSTDRCSTPIAAGSGFWLRATSDSGLPVTQSVISGNVTPTASGTGTVHYQVNDPPGQIVIAATQAGDARFAPALEVRFVASAGAGGSTYTVTPPTPQTISLSQECAPAPAPASASAAPCSPVYPLAVNSPFWVRATSDSGLPVSLTVISGHVNPTERVVNAQDDPVEFHVTAPGTIVIKAQQAGDAHYAPAQDVQLVLEVGKPVASACDGLFPPPAPRQVQPIDLPGIITLVGAPTPFVLAAQGKNTILVYSTRQPLRAEDDRILRNIEDNIRSLAGRTADSLGVSTAKPFTVDLAIPHAPALGDLATRLKGLNYSQFTVQDVGAGEVRITAASQPDCDLWKAFLSDVRQTAWRPTPEPFYMKLFYLAASDVSTAYAAVTGGAAGGGGAAAAASGASGSAASGGSGSAASGASGSAASGGSGSAGASAAPAAATLGSATIAVSQPPGSILSVKSDTTPCVVAGLSLGNSSTCTSAGGAGGAAAGTAPAAASGAAASTPAAPKLPGLAPLGTDQLVFSDANPGNDAAIEELRRVLAQLDLPRPELLINAWVMQNSTANPKAMGAFSSTVNDLVSQYNDRLENVVLLGWRNIKEQIAKGNYFDETFYHYVADRYIANTHPKALAKPPQEAAQRFLNTSPATMGTPQVGKLSDFGVCDDSSYCLGYTNLFRPLKPRLTDLLLTQIAAKNPACVTSQSIVAVETGGEPPKVDCGNPGQTPAAEPPKSPEVPSTVDCACDFKVGTHEKHAKSKSDPDEHLTEARDRCRYIWKFLDLDHEQQTCASQDMRGVLASLADSLTSPNHPGVNPYLRCFRAAAVKLMRIDPTDPQPSGVGLMRAAVADFLFNYKLSQQYPHEFAPYELSQSADTLNSALSPFMDAFNQDLAAFQRFVRADVQYKVERLNREHDQRCCAKRLFGLDKPSFFNDGLLTVRTISGQPASVSATSQSFLDASTAPTISALLNSLTGAGGGGGSGSGGAGGSGSGGSAGTGTTVNINNSNGAAGGGGGGGGGGNGILGANALLKAQTLAGLVNAYQTTYAQIGRSLSLTATPRSLASGSSAEIVVTLNADESAAPTYYGGAQNGANANISRVSSHDTSTTIRVESLKLFEVSSYSAILQRSKSRFPLIPPFVELPYIGTIAGIPLPPAKEYHTSTAVMSAIIMPTAADIALGLRFAMDQVVDGEAGTCRFFAGAGANTTDKPCHFSRAVAMRDLNQEPIRNFNKSMINCLAMGSPYSSINEPTGQDACKNLTFDNVPRE